MAIWHPKWYDPYRWYNPYRWAWAPGSVALPSAPKWGIPRATMVRYEYKCPHCGFVNVRSTPTLRIVCTRCGRVFTP